MSAKGAAGRICAGDTVMGPSLPVLAYGEVWQRAGFTCRSEQTGLTCFNAMQRGFSLARAKQEVFSVKRSSKSARNRWRTTKKDHRKLLFAPSIRHFPATVAGDQVR